MENTLRVMTPEETKVTSKNSGPSFSHVTNGTKGKSIINQSFQHLQYEKKVTGFFLVQVEISLTKVMNGKYTESDDSRRNKSTYSAQKESSFPARRISLHRNGVDKCRRSKHIVRCRPWKKNGVTTHIHMR